MRYQLKISIIIPAYNEEQNIKILIESLLAQKISDGNLEEIIVVSDGCTDRTVELVKSIHDPRIKLIEYSKRRGMTYGQNNITSKAEADVLIMLDADVLPGGETFLQEMIKPIIDDREIGIVGADVISIAPKSLFEKIIATSHELKTNIYQQINNGNNIYTCHGRARAFSKTFYKKIKWPHTYPEDSFSYLFCSIGYIN